MKPVVIVNCKTYAQATGEHAVKIARACEKISLERNVDMRVAVQAADLYRVTEAVTIPVYAEHVDPINPGRNTGYILPEDVKAEGAYGTLLNHSEHRLEKNVLAESVQEARGAGLKVIVCAATLEEGAAHAALKPEFVAVEPPALIGGSVSVSKAEPGIIRKAVEQIKAPVLVGAGVHDGADVKVALELGAKGVLVASSVATAENPDKALAELLDF